MEEELESVLGQHLELSCIPYPKQPQARSTEQDPNSASPGQMLARQFLQRKSCLQD